MDLEEWELLPDDGFLEIHDDGGKKIYSRKYGSGPAGVLETNYFVSSEADQDPVSQVFFKKMKEPEFVDMKVESPTSTRSGIMPQIDGAGFYQFEENEEAYKVEALDSESCTSKVKGDSEMEMDENNWGFNIWKWSLTGIGAICSFGVAAATVSIIVLGSSQKSKQQNQKLQLQFYANDKRIKQVVHHASKLNEAIFRGVPLTRAHVTFGGYYEGL
ncbi:uncharacterized protein LOC111384891 [Olea europaea subsp. europaea]|uniref:Uncharacterized protein LOC111384891 n=2 Tax=Olea europaea subsp. europaea TaxID=158383 RepID=A0A8S0UPY0_OLEEU|nr:uncharacterized protein LOC111384891 [Olea europaea subsp. europaea]